MIPFSFAISAVVAFFLGAIPFAYLFVKKMKGIDIRRTGSGNVGATNAARHLGWHIGILIILLDALKGAVAAYILPEVLDWFLSRDSARIFNQLGYDGVRLCLGLAAFFGHCYSPFLGFKGGKGVATGIGVYLVIAPKAILLTLAVCIPLILITRYVSLGSVVGAILLPVGILVFQWNEKPWIVVAITALLSLIVILRHRGNIRRLMSGSESKT